MTLLKTPTGQGLWEPLVTGELLLKCNLHSENATYLLPSSSMVVVISLCRSSSNLLFWDLFLQQKKKKPK